MSQRKLHKWFNHKTDRRKERPFFCSKRTFVTNRLLQREMTYIIIIFRFLSSSTLLYTLWSIINNLIWKLNCFRVYQIQTIYLIFYNKAKSKSSWIWEYIFFNCKVSISEWNIQFWFTVAFSSFLGVKSHLL